MREIVGDESFCESSRKLLCEYTRDEFLRMSSELEPEELFPLEKPHGSEWRKMDGLRVSRIDSIESHMRRRLERERSRDTKMSKKKWSDKGFLFYFVIPQ